MQQAPSPLNPWLLSYILQNYKSHSRYEVDRYLIEAGYNPSEIEVTWKAVLSGSYPKELVEAKAFLRRTLYVQIVGWIFVLAVILGACLLFFWLTMVFFKNMDDFA